MITLIKPYKQSQSRSVAIAQILTGNINGSNKTFITPHEYEPGRISLLYNGQALHSPEDFEETGTNELTLTYIAPRTGDILRANYEYLGGTSGGSIGVSDHGDLSGLSDDDHPQYLNNARGDIRYYTKSEIDSMIGGNTKSGQLNIDNGATETWVALSPALSSADYSIAISIENTSDNGNTAIYAYNITAKTINGFEITYTDNIDSANYVLNWIVAI